MAIEDKLLLDLPPLAPDYSGVCSALFELGGLLVIHDASGCTGNYTGFDEPRWFGSNSAVFSSGIREMDAVMGDDERLLEKVLAACEDLKPKFVALMGSPVPMVIGTDLDGIAAEITARTGLAAFGFNTKGFDYYDRGVAEAYKRLERLHVKGRGKTPMTANLLGVTPLDFGTADAVAGLKAAVRDAGLSLNACWSMSCSLQELEKSAAAAVNIVVSWSGLELARRLKERFGTPYGVGFPVGERAKAAYAGKIAAALSGEDAPARESGGAGGRTLILGEQVAANSLRETLEGEFSCGPCRVASFFEMDREISRSGDTRLGNENELRTFARENGFSTVVGDPLFREFFGPAAHFVSLPHVAVSGRLFWDQKYPCIGDGAGQWLKENFS